MGRLRVLSGREVCRILELEGFLEVRRRGSHVVMQRRTPQGTTTVPVPDHRELRLGTR
ncbi:MAG: type II toxin-antitoxin system HicA family toxin [Planctomycetia bacterium]|nr:type II toxin-antitoxin system HicA family toxin [Planctomycetia bacterium]